MKRILVLLVVFVLFNACVANRAALNQSIVNRKAADALKLGMSKADVLATMGEPMFREAKLTAEGQSIEKLKWLTDYDHHIYTVVTIRSGTVSAITQEEGPMP